MRIINQVGQRVVNLVFLQVLNSMMAIPRIGQLINQEVPPICKLSVRLVIPLTFILLIVHSGH